MSNFHPNRKLEVNIFRFLLPGEDREEPVWLSEKREYGGEPLRFCTV